MPPANKLDLNKLAQDPRNRVELSLVAKPPELKAERDHRLAEEAAKSHHERIRDLIILAVVLFGYATIVSVCVWLVTSKESAPEDKKWATATLASIVLALTGYLVGKREGSK
jgi:hypothetical protein